MSEHTGAQIKDARTAAGMTQKELAESVDGLNAKMISEAERGLRELTDEQLVAIAEATGSESLLPAADGAEAPEAPADDVAVPAVGEENILELFNAADPAVKEAALSVLKGETPQGKNFLSDILPKAIEMLSGAKDGDLLAAIIGFLASEEGMAFVGTLKGALGNVTSMFSRDGAAGDTDQDGKKAPGSLLVFTFSYAVAIYVLLLSFYFWLIRTDIKPEK